jgi:hypothetical protein
MSFLDAETAVRAETFFNIKYLEDYKGKFQHRRQSNEASEFSTLKEIRRMKF